MHLTKQQINRIKEDTEIAIIHSMNQSNELNNTVSSLKDEEEKEEQQHLEMTTIKREETCLNESLKEKIIFIQQNKFFKNIFHYSNQFVPHICLIGTLFTFAGYCVLTPHALKMIHPTIFTTIRNSLIALILLPISLILDKNYSFRSQNNLQFYGKNNVIQFIVKKIPKWKLMKELGICGIVFTLNQVTFTIGLSMTNATIAGILQPLIPVMVCILSILLKREKWSAIKVVGVFIAVSGAIAMLFITSQFKRQKDNNYVLLDLNNCLTKNNIIPSSLSFFIGTLFLIANGFLVSTYLLLLKKLLEKKIPPTTVTFWSCTLGSFVLILFSLFYLPSFNINKIDKATIIGILYSGTIHGTISFLLSSIASKFTTPTVVAIYNTLCPIVSTAMAFIVLNERVSPYVAIGAVLIIGGVTMVIYSRWKEAKEQQVVVSLQEMKIMKETTIQNNH
ncbi:hypothetical protein ABK040_007356 [Willaertia magna]